MTSLQGKGSTLTAAITYTVPIKAMGPIIMYHRVELLNVQLKMLTQLIPIVQGRQLGARL